MTWGDDFRELLLPKKKEDNIMTTQLDEKVKDFFVVVNHDRWRMRVEQLSKDYNIPIDDLKKKMMEHQARFQVQHNFANARDNFTDIGRYYAAFEAYIKKEK
jgi:hypothetical protein